MTRGPRQAQDLASRLEGYLRELEARPSLAALGLAPVLGGVRVAAVGARVRGELVLDEGQREQIAQRLQLVAEAIASARAPAAQGR